MGKISWRGWLIIILYVMSLIGTFITHGMLLTRYSKDNITVECTGKRVGVSDSYKAYDVVYFDFEMVNDSVCLLESYSGEVKITEKSSGDVLLSKTYSSMENVDKKSSEEFYIYLYDISVDNGGVENFSAIYENDFSDLEIAYTVTKADFTEQNFAFTFLKTVCPIPTGILGCFVVGVIIAMLVCLIFKGSVESAGAVAKKAAETVIIIITK